MKFTIQGTFLLLKMALKLLIWSLGNFLGLD